MPVRPIFLDSALNYVQVGAAVLSFVKHATIR